jgi:hypothetical protein
MSAKSIKSAEGSELLAPYEFFFKRVESLHGAEIVDLCRSRILKQVQSGRMVAGQAILESIMRERRLPVYSKPGSVSFVY